MEAIFGGDSPKIAPPAPPPPVPTTDQARMRRQQADDAARRRGRSSMIQTGPDGVGSTPVGTKTLVGS